jgi:hypothetical protein
MPGSKLPSIIKTKPSSSRLSSEASRLEKVLRAEVRKRLAEARKVPVAVLLWGPGLTSGSPMFTARKELRDELRRDGHAAFFSEELCDASLPDSIRLQQLAQAQEVDLVVSIPCTPGSIGEIHDFAADRRVNSKTLVFINEAHVGGYSQQSLMTLNSLIACRVERYPSEADTKVIRDVTLQEVQRIREMKYILAGRY